MCMVTFSYVMYTGDIVLIPEKKSKFFFKRIILFLKKIHKKKMGPLLSGILAYQKYF